MAVAKSELGRMDERWFLLKKLAIDLEIANWRSMANGLGNMGDAANSLGRRAEAVASLALALDLSQADEDDDGVSVAKLCQAAVAIEQGRFADGERLLGEFLDRPLPSIGIYRPGDAEIWSCDSQFYQGMLNEADLRQGCDLAVKHRNVLGQLQFLALRCEWLLTRDQFGPALDAIDEALKIVNRLGTPSPDYHDLRAWALAGLGRVDDARAELANGEQRRFAAEAWAGTLGDREQVRTCALNAYKSAWGQGPPYILWYELERSRALLKELGEPEPQLPPFDPSKVKPIPFEQETAP